MFKSQITEVILKIFTGKNFALLLSFLILFVSQENKAQAKGILRGFVADSLSGEALPFASVYISEINRGTNSDARGYFVMASLPNTRLTVTATYVGYKIKTMMVRIDPYKVTDLRFNLSPSPIQLQTVETSERKYPKETATDLSVERISIRELESLPKGIELDIFRSLQNFSGVQTGGDVSARYYVRGSASNQNLVMLDKIPIYNPFHALGIFSSIDPDMISSLEFFKGGFPAEYTNGLSSVLKVITKDGNKNNFGGKAGISFLSAKLLLEGPIPDGSFIISGRKNISNYILKKFRNNNTVPADFYDLFFKVNYSNDNILEDAKFSVSAFLSNDEIMNKNSKREDFKWNNKAYSFNYFQISNSPLFYEVDVSISNFSGEVIPNFSGAKGIKNELNNFTMRMDFNYVYESKDELSGGFRISDVSSLLTLSNFRGYSATEEKHGVSVSAYAEYKLLRASFIGATAGARVHGTRLGGGGSSLTVEPRSSFTLRLIPEIALKGSWGLFMQDLVTISDENEVVSVFEPWIITPLYLKPANAIHYIIGLEILPFQNLSINIENYYKIIQNQAIVNYQKYFDTDKDLIPGEGKSSGLEFQSKYRNNLFTFTAAYSLMYATNEVNGIEYHPRYDSRHNLNLVLDFDFGNGWGASAVWSYTSGLPFTQIAGYYDRLTIDEITNTDYILNSYSPFIILGDMNIGRLPDYHRLDLNLSKKIQIDRLKITMDFSVMNAYDRKNLFYFKRDTGERVDMLPFLPSLNLKVEL